MGKRAVKVKDLSLLEQYSDPQIGHLGKMYVFTGTIINEEQEYNEHLYVQDLYNDTPHQWTFGDVKDRFPRFSPDDQTIVFLSNRSGVNQLWSMSTTGGAPKQLTYLEHGAGEPHWSPDGRYILFAAVYKHDEDPSKEKKKDQDQKQNKASPLRIQRLKYKSDAQGLHDDQTQQLILFDVQNQTCKKLSTNDVDHTVGGWAPDSRTFAYTANVNGDHHIGQDIFIRSIDIDDDPRPLTGSEGTYHSLNWSPDGLKLACLGHTFTHDGATQNQLWTFEAETAEKTSLTPGFDAQLGDAMISDFQSAQHNPGPVWVDDQTLLFTASQAGRTGLFSTTLDGDVETVLDQNQHIYSFSLHAESNKLIAGISKPTDPGNFYMISLKDGKVKKQTDANASYLSEVELQEPEIMTFTSRDGWQVQGWFMYPYHYQPGDKYPLILEIHGGPHAMYGYSFFHELQVLTGLGYAVLYTNPRGSHGYGQTFVDAVRGDYGGKDYSDLMNAVEETIKHYAFIDESRLGVTGGSYGGFMTNWIISHTNRFHAAITQRSIANWISFYGVSDIGYYFTKWEIGEHLLDDPQKLWDHSPLKYAREVDTPLLILHGEKDFRCPIEQAEQWFTVLKYNDKEVEFVRFPEANHELSRNGPPHLRKARLNEMVAWFQRYL
ncbi:acylaminoacyl-peptidase [Geomicrobium halophilum]|uniref:Acylaminoacyl-peptidase n=1 Tax=Geomicrobium halophilum TaxID=549000 RepID=A0A841PIL3_9BACL|nr:S9 family peptidase [Geomicrobium halophilum]MBB6448579.1 acylaminoacyl-peptidase [Geomicrobium halophilum]